MQVAKHL